MAAVTADAGTGPGAAPRAARGVAVEVAALARHYGTAPALDGIDLQVNPGEFVALLGPSGSGKTTLLRILAGLDFPDSGAVRIGGRDVADVPARGRGVGFVFQSYALFRHMTVFDNVAFGLRMQKRRHRPTAAAIRERVRRLLALVQIPELERRYPTELSGGQQQRVALARALAIEPPLLLLDEPFGALDAQVRRDLRRWLRALHERLGVTSLFVTHDQDEAMEMADRVAVMRQGRIVQFDTPDAVLARPANSFVAGFLGDSNRLECTVRGGLAHPALPGLAPLPAPGLPDGPALAFARPFEVLAGPAEPGAANAVLQGLRPDARGLRAVVGIGGETLEAIVAPGWAAPERGAPCLVRITAAKVFAD